MVYDITNAETFKNLDKYATPTHATGGAHTHICPFHSHSAAHSTGWLVTTLRLSLCGCGCARHSIPGGSMR
jgi:hypothetical protein